MFRRSIRHSQIMVFRRSDSISATVATTATRCARSCPHTDKINNAAKLIGDDLYMSACHNNAIANPDHSANLDSGVARYRYERPIFHSGSEAGG
jgi:hypothetical protein